MHVVHPHDAFAVNVDQLLVEYVASQQNFSVATHKWPQVEDVGIQAHAALSKIGDAPARQEKIAAAVPRHKPGHRRVVVFAQAHNYILERRHTLAFEVENRPTQNLGQIQHDLISS